MTPLPRSTVLRRLRPYGLHVFLLFYSGALLYADGRFHSHRAQLVLGAVTLAVLAVCVRTAPRERWAEIWVCVPVATLFEVFGSLVWGGYTYRFENIPVYVPPGHALVYVFGITAASLPLVKAHERRVGHVVLALCTAWTVAGLTVLPLVTHRVDASGALIWPLFAWCILRSGRSTLFAGIWVATATLEIAGTWAGDWVWHPVAPWTHLPSGNPPSAIAAGYAVIDGTVLLATPFVLRAIARLLRLGRGPRVQPEPAAASAMEF
jgi:hypothetical protein